MKGIEKRKLFKLVLCVIIFSSFFFIVHKSIIIREVLSVLFISFVIAYTLKPLLISLSKRGINKRIGSIILIILLILIFFGTITLLLPSVFKESLNISPTIKQIMDKIEYLNNKIKFLQNNKIMYVVLENINIKISASLSKILTSLFDAALSIGSNIISMAVIPIIAYYFLADGDLIFNKLIKFFPLKSRKVVKKVSIHIDKILGRYIISQIFLCILIGVITFIILLILKVDFPVLLSLINAFFNIIPYFGPVFGAIPIVAIAALKSKSVALWTLFWLYLLQQLEGNIISPKITADSIDMHPLIVILLLIIGEKVGGFIGMIVFVPLGVIVKVIYEDLNYYLF